MRQNNFNLLRLLLALLVMLSHAPELQDGDRHRELLTRLFHTLSFGELAVDGFFLLSGYLIVQSWQAAPVAGVFLRKRILRIFPGFVVASLVCVYLVGPLGADSASYFRELSTASVLLALPVLHAPVIPAVFDGLPYARVNGSMWTIALEFLCYLGVLALGLAGAIRNRRLWLGLTLAGFSLYLLGRSGLPLRWTVQMVTTHPLVRLGSLFGAGGCFYLYRNVLRYTPRGALLAGVALVTLLFSPPLAEVALAAFGGYLLFYFAHKPLPFTAAVNRLPDCSYGIYLYGWPAQMLVLWYLPGHSPWLLLVLALAVVLPIALLSCWLVEQPMLRYKLKRSAAPLRT
jgi:peptidoglycan/LPS O-acetylase OafA/YrhL